MTTAMSESSPSSNPLALSDLIGTSPAMSRLRATIQRVSISDRPVLVLGPTGSGKELVARAIHSLGAKPLAPLVDLNCAAVPESLIEGQLFGWERGAFTGAQRRQEGLFALARDGTLFLDEIGELYLPLQAKLLRVLETRCFRPLGGSGESRFDGRVVAATHADLWARVHSGDFREDLYYRLGVLVVTVPGLHERREDIPELVLHFAASQRLPLSFTDEALASLARAPWPGNVRQLRNAIDRLAVFADDGQRITPEVIRDVLGGGSFEPLASAALLRSLARKALATDATNKLAAMEDALVDEAVALAGGNRSQAARLLGVDRKVVERRLAARGIHGVRRPG